MNASSSDFERELSRGRESLVAGDAGPAVQHARSAIQHAVSPHEQMRARRLLADGLHQAGRLDQARRAAEEALIHGEPLPDDDPERILALNLLGVLCKYLGDFDDSQDYYERVLELVNESAAEAEPALVATVHHNLGGLAHSRSDFVEAERQTRLALEIRERWSSGRADHGIAAEHGQLASILSSLGRDREALELIGEAAREFSELYGQDHIEVAIAHTTRGAILHRAGRREEAERAYREGLRLRQSTLGEEHPELAPTLLNLGRLYEELGDATRAAGYNRRARDVLDGVVSDDHPVLAVARERVGAAG